MSMGKLSLGAIIAISMAGLFLTLTTGGLLTAFQVVPTNGNVTAVNVGVYQDSACKLNLTSVNWGTLYPGNTTAKTIYVKNTGTVPVTLSITSESWIPSNASKYMTLTWNRSGYVLNPNTSVDAALTLAVSSSAANVTNFSFNIIITGTQS